MEDGSISEVDNADRDVGEATVLGVGKVSVPPGGGTCNIGRLSQGEKRALNRDGGDGGDRGWYGKGGREGGGRQQHRGGRGVTRGGLLAL